MAAELTRKDVIDILNAGGNLAGVRLDGLDLNGLDFSAANLAGASLVGARLTDTRWGTAPHQRRLFRDERIRRLAGANFDGADLSGAKFENQPAEELREILKRAGVSTAKTVFTDKRAAVEAEHARQRQLVEEFKRTGKVTPDKGAAPRRYHSKPSSAF